MKTATVADLRRKFTDISRWIEAGEQVQITRHGQPFATLIPTQEKKEARPWPNLNGRLRKAFSNPVNGSTAEELLDYLRGDY
jgi:antitoxin (DNA-binding transcriptional repressor) of toxin-antitoxin stability system